MSMTPSNNTNITASENKKRGFFKKNKDKIAKYGTIFVNILFIIGVGVSAVLSKGTSLALTPIFAATFLPSFFTLVFQIILQTAPQKVEECKNLFLKAVIDEDDRSVIESAYNEVMTHYNNSINGSVSVSERQPDNQPTRDMTPPSNTPNNTPSDHGDDGTVIQMNAYYNKRTKEYEITPRPPPYPISAKVPPLGVRR